ncbi:MAG TPA: methylated-DNA--[protein]-cysteine S-methyltransferase [Methylomirabilota bacterium]|jgi:O-6-methylguanine DNA methyltransferase|nr:methylated-DNA--[protein]-cysteine S-methyltransferase [Methylomirabilota bacterium]
MSAANPTCREIERDLVAVAAGEAAPVATRVVERHLAVCRDCRDELERYRVLEGMVTDLRRAPLPGADPALSRAELEARLADIRARMVAYGIFSSPLGKILIARSELGISLVEYLESESAATSHLARLAGGEMREDKAGVEAVYQELLEYLDHRRTRLDWPLDLRWVRSDFQRRVLTATAELPYGAVTSYAGIAQRIGTPSAVRAVAQALRRNPVPIVIPCHRVIGNGGDLTGYAGNKISLKRTLLSLEGVPVAVRARKIERDHMYVRAGADSEYCVPTCGSLSRQSLAGLTLFGSRGHAEAVGLTPCTSCRPDLHPLSS